MGIISLEKSNRLIWLGRYTERTFTICRTLSRYYDDMIADKVLATGYLPERKAKSAATGAKSSAAYERLVAVGEMLMASIKRSKGRDNKSLAKFADQLRQLLEKWEA